MRSSFSRRKCRQILNMIDFFNSWGNWVASHIRNEVKAPLLSVDQQHSYCTCANGKSDDLLRGSRSCLEGKNLWDKALGSTHNGCWLEEHPLTHAHIRVYGKGFKNGLFNVLAKDGLESKDSKKKKKSHAVFHDEDSVSIDKTSPTHNHTLVADTAFPSVVSQPSCVVIQW